MAGVGKMRYGLFIMYNITGAVMWILAFTLAGFFFGSIPLVKENFSLIIYAIIGISFIAVGSVVLNVIRSMKAKKRACSEQE